MPKARGGGVPAGQQVFFRSFFAIPVILLWLVWRRELAVGLRHKLATRGLAVFEAQHVPPGDGGIALGQAWVAREELRRGLL